MDIIKVILTSLLSVAVLFVITKVMGHKQIAQLDFFDYISGITIGSIGADLAIDLETPWKSLIAVIVYGIASILLSAAANKYQKSRKIINGAPSIIMDNGKIYRENLKKSKLNLSDFMMMCRELGYFELNDIQTAVFEANGKLTVLPKSEKRPLTPQDMDISLPKQSIGTEIIMDGNILHENLKRKGLDIIWLKNELDKQNCNSSKEILLAVCDNNNKLTIYKNGL